MLINEFWLSLTFRFTLRLVCLLLNTLYFYLVKYLIHCLFYVQLHNYRHNYDLKLVKGYNIQYISTEGSGGSGKSVQITRAQLCYICFCLFRYYHYYWGRAVAWWLRHYATNRQVAGSIPDGVIGIFQWHNPSGRTMALGSTQPPTEMSTRCISWG